jgi:Flp pilus assembly protein TadG
MLRNRSPQKLSRRGAATVEFALVVPVLVSILMFSMFLTEIILAKFKLQEASRYVAWEMTSYTLSDYADGDHNKAFNAAMTASVADANERYADFNSVEPNAGNFAVMLRADPVATTITNQTVSGIDASEVFPGGGSGEEVLSAVGKTVNFFIDHFKFNTKGQVQVEISSRLASLVLPRRYLQKSDGDFYDVDNWGGRDLSNLPVRNRFTLIANGWHLPDGGDALVMGKRAGVHDGGSDHGMFRQVDRMKFLGVGDYMSKVGLDKLSDIGSLILPDFFGPFVAAHNYKPSESARDCNKPKHGAQEGLHNLDRENGPGLDQKKNDNNDDQRCFDTAPFRDTHEYEQSLYRKIFMARGDYFMGCKNQMADMPNTPAADPSTAQDKNENKITCE